MSNYRIVQSACIQDCKSLCAAVTISATMVDPKFDVYILTPATPENRSNRQ